MDPRELDSDTADTTSAPLSVCCRPGQANVAIAPFGLTIGLVCLIATFSARDIASAVVVGAFGCAFAGASVALLWWALRSCIQADETGLRWRGWRGGWQSASWADVRDYYKTTAGKGNARSVSGWRLEVRGGRTVRFGADWKSERELREAVVRQAVDARVHDWKLHGTRNFELPREFAYDPRRIRNAERGLWIGWALLACLFGGVATGVVWDAFRHTSVDFAELAVLPLAIGYVPAFVWLTRGELAAIRLARTWQREKITVAVDGLTFDDGREKTFIRWNEISAFDFTGGSKPLTTSNRKTVFHTCVIATEFWGTIQFSTAITNALELTTIVRECATAAVEHKRDTARAEALGGVQARWSGGDENVGDLLYHTRTRTGRCLLWGVWSLASAPLLAGALMWCVDRAYAAVDGPRRSGGDPLTMGIISASVAVAAALMTIAYYRVHLRIGRDGITWRGLWRTRFVPWTAVKGCDVVGDSGAIIVSSGPSIRFTPSLLAYGIEIRDEVMKHVTAVPGR